MTETSLFSKTKFRLTITAAGNAPLTFEVNPERGWKLLGGILAGVASLLVGTLLFFRELEINRRLEDKVLELKTNEKIAKLTALPLPLVVKAEPYSTKSEASPVSDIAAHLSDLQSQCQPGVCDAHVHLIPTGTGSANGSLLMVLETELPRIGSGAIPTEQPDRRVYHFYPTAPSREKFSETELSQFAPKTFSFSRALRTQHRFLFEPTLKPLRLLVFVFDEAGRLIQQEERSLHVNP